MELVQQGATSQAYFVFLFLFLIVGYLVHVRYGYGMSSVPGPWLASFTDFWRFQAVLHGRFELTNRALHERYGNLVRVGPRCVSVADPYEIPKIYGISRLFPKSDYYKASQAIVNGKRVAGLFQTTNEEVHKAAKRPIAHAYAMTTLLDYEYLVDSTSKVLVERLTTLFAGTGTVCSFDKWLQWYAFDVIGEVTFSRRLGFLEHAKDVGDLISILSSGLHYAAVVGQMPWLDVILKKNWLMLKLLKPRSAEIPRFVMGFVQNRLRESEENEVDQKTERQSKDFLSKFTQAATLSAGKIPDSMHLGWAISNINAGSDTTAISLRAIFYFLLRNPVTLGKLKEELRAAELSELPTFKETYPLPYLTSVIKESLRLHAPVGLLLERVVPAGGVTLSGHDFPEGTIVGCNPYVIHRSKEVYGQKYNVDEFWPERWLEADETSKSNMDRYFLAFGSGKRVCIGRNISMLEIYKLVPLLLERFKISLANPEKEWTVWNTFFVHQKDIDVYLEPLHRNK